MLKYIDFYRDRLNIYSGKLITATAIDAKLEKKLISVIENRKEGTLELHKEVNPDLIGGFILEVDNTRWDASIKRQLQAIMNGLKV
jgi:F-type H+-transporting ATPase subunit delta